MNRRPWHKGEEVAAHYYRACGLSYPKIGKLLGRARSSVHYRLNPEAQRRQAEYNRSERGKATQRRRWDKLGRTPLGTPKACAVVDCENMFAYDAGPSRYCHACRERQAAEECVVAKACLRLIPALRERQNGRCARTGERLIGKVVVHHVLPWRMFPPNTRDQHTIPREHRVGVRPVPQGRRRPSPRGVRVRQLRGLTWLTETSEPSGLPPSGNRPWTTRCWCRTPPPARATTSPCEGLPPW